MISSFKCQICLQSFGQRSSPRVCNKCGNSICESCLTGIFIKQGGYICPYCKNKAQQIWAKNISIINMMDIQKGTNLCFPHKRKAVSFCSSPTCNLPIAICDVAQCSKMHKQRGTNNIPMSLILQTPDPQQDKQIICQVIQNFYSTVEQSILKLISIRKAETIQRIVKGNLQKCVFKQQNQKIVNNLKKCQLTGITSQMLSKIKAQLLQEQDNQEQNVKNRTIQIVQSEKKQLSQLIHNKIISTQINFISTFDVIKNSCIENYEKNMQVESSPSKKITIYQQESFELRNPDDPIQSFLKCTKSTQQYKLLFQIFGMSFKPKLIFTASKNSLQSFKPTLANKTNIFIRIQLQDGKLIGCYFKRPYVDKFTSEQFVVDPDAFICWFNTSKVFKANKNSVSQYDISPDYLLSVGNTYKWDGFWFIKNFGIINPDITKNEIRSQQYNDLNIPIPNKNVLRFEVFVLEFE